MIPKLLLVLVSAGLQVDVHLVTHSLSIMERSYMQRRSPDVKLLSLVLRLFWQSCDFGQ